MKYISIPMFLSISVALMTFSLVLLWNSLPPQIPLFYSLSQIDDQVADLLYIAILPFIMIVFVAIHLGLRKYVFTNELFVQKILWHASLVTIALITYSFVRIIFLVT